MLRPAAAPARRVPGSGDLGGLAGAAGGGDDLVPAAALGAELVGRRPLNGAVALKAPSLGAQAGVRRAEIAVLALQGVARGAEPAGQGFGVAARRGLVRQGADLGFIGGPQIGGQAAVSAPVMSDQKRLALPMKPVQRGCCLSPQTWANSRISSFWRAVRWVGVSI